MNSTDKRILITATVFIFVGIIFGALGAHALEKVLTTEQLSSYEVGVKYQIYHGIALLVLVALAHKLNFTLKLIYRFLVIGVTIFSGSIYALVLQDLVGIKLGMIFGPLTPIGGALMIIGWLLFLIKLLKTNYE